MNAQLFIYTRNLDNDYKLVYAPNDDFCSVETRRFFLKQARSVINIETYTPIFDQPRWLYSRKGDVVIFGVGVMNSVLNKDYSNDYTGTPVRGFFGMVIKKSSIEMLPFDITFFQAIYSKYIVPLWNYERDDFKKKGITMDIDIASFHTINPIENGITINANPDKTVILGSNYSEKSLLENVMCINDDVTLVTGLVDKAHAFDKESVFMNALVVGTTSTEERQLKFKTCTITTATNGNGMITPNGTITAKEGESKWFAISANKGYQIKDVFVDDVSVGAVKTYTFPNLSANHKILASFVVYRAGESDEGEVKIDESSYGKWIIKFADEVFDFIRNILGVNSRKRIKERHPNNQKTKSTKVDAISNVENRISDVKNVTISNPYQNEFSKFNEKIEKKEDNIGTKNVEFYKPKDFDNDLKGYSEPIVSNNELKTIDEIPKESDKTPFDKARDKVQ